MTTKAETTVAKRLGTALRFTPPKRMNASDMADKLAGNLGAMRRRYGQEFAIKAIPYRNLLTANMRNNQEDNPLICALSIAGAMQKDGRPDAEIQLLLATATEMAAPR